MNNVKDILNDINNNENIQKTIDEYNKLSPKEQMELRVKWENEIEGDRNLEDGIECPLCKNRGYITYFKEENGKYYDYIKNCSCLEKRKQIIRAKNSGLGEYLNKRSKDYEAKEDWQIKNKQKMINYCNNDFDSDLWFVALGQSGCVDCDTEFFNGVEWKKISDYVEGDKVLQFNEDRTANLVYPSRYIKNECKTLWHFETDRGALNQTLSLNHKFVYETSKGHLAYKEFKDVICQHNKNKQGFYGKILTTFSYNGKGIDLNENEIRLMCAYICDGTKRNANQGAFNLKKERKIKRLRELLKDVKHKEYHKSNGYTLFTFYPPIKEKTFSSKWYNCTNEQLMIVCDEVLNWDGHIDCTGRKSFSTTNKQIADFIQFAFSSIGYRATIICYDRVGQKRGNYIRKSLEYNVIISKENKLTLSRTGGKNKTKIEEVETKDGYEYCFTVPSGMLVLRRNDRIFITGNCGKTLMCSIIANHLLYNCNKNVCYITWTDFISKLKRDVMSDNTQSVSDYLDIIKKADVLFIDELLKKYNDTDLKYIMEIINYRYTNNLKTIITSERTLENLLDIDEATFGRVFEKCGDYLIEIPKDRNKNYRLKKLNNRY